jgi:hypothetical protein
MLAKAWRLSRISGEYSYRQRVGREVVPILISTVDLWHVAGPTDYGLYVRYRTDRKNRLDLFSLDERIRQPSIRKSTFQQ